MSVANFLRTLVLVLTSILIGSLVSSLALAQAGGEFYGRWKTVGQLHDVQLEILFDQNQSTDAGRGYVYVTTRNPFRVNCPNSLGRLCVRLEQTQDRPIITRGVQFANGQALAAVKLPGEDVTFLIEIVRQRGGNGYRMRLYHPERGLLLDSWAQRSAHPCQSRACRAVRFSNLAEAPEKYYGPFARRSFRRSYSQYLEILSALPGRVYAGPSDNGNRFGDPGSSARAAYCGVTKGRVYRVAGGVPNSVWNGDWTIWSKAGREIGAFRTNRQVGNFEVVANAAFGGPRFGENYTARFSGEDAGPWGVTFTVRAKAASNDLRASGQMVICALDDEQQARGKIRLNGRQVEIYVRPSGTGAPVNKQADREPKRVAEKQNSSGLSFSFDLGGVILRLGEDGISLDVSPNAGGGNSAPIVDEDDLELPPIVEEIAWAPQYGGDRLTLWDHNGSTMAYESAGVRRWIWYWEPRAALEGVVERGTLLFDGRKEGGRLIGSARTFSQQCGTVNFYVEGEIGADNRSVLMRGRRPVRSTNCEVVRTAREELLFDYLARDAGQGALIGASGGYSENSLQETVFQVIGLQYGALNMRSGPGTNYAVIAKLNYDSTGILVERCIPGVSQSRWQRLSDNGRRSLISKAWCEVSFGRLTGYVYGKYLGPAR